MKKTFIYHVDWLDYEKHMSMEEKLNLHECIFNYNTWKEVSTIWWVKFVWERIKQEIDQDNAKYEEVVNKRKEAWKLGWRPAKKQTKAKKANGFWEKQTKAKKPERDNDNDKSLSHTSNDVWVVNNIESISNSINILLSKLKEQCDILNIAYDKSKEREFAKHILTAKEYWEFADKIWQTREEFALNIMKASVSINYWKVCSWPMAIYQNYSWVYNETRKKNNKASNRVAILPWV